MKASSFRHLRKKQRDNAGGVQSFIGVCFRTTPPPFKALSIVKCSIVNGFSKLCNKVLLSIPCLYGLLRQIKVKQALCYLNRWIQIQMLVD